MKIGFQQADGVIDDLALGYGVEDIALMRQLPVADVRAFVQELREEGLIEELFGDDE